MSPWEKVWPSKLFAGSWSWGTILKTVPILGSDPPGSRQRQRLVCRKLTGEHDGISSHGPVARVGSGSWRNWNATKASVDPGRALEPARPCRVVLTWRRKAFVHLWMWTVPGGRGGSLQLNYSQGWDWLRVISCQHSQNQQEWCLSPDSIPQHLLLVIVKSSQRCCLCTKLLTCLVWF